MTKMNLRAPAAALSFLALVTLGACASGAGAANDKPEAITPTEQFAIEVRPHPEELQLASHATGLSGNQASALDDFYRQWLLAEGGAITLKAPEHGVDPAGAFRTVTAARDLLVSQGVDPAKIRIIGYNAQGQAHAPIIVGYTRYDAHGPECGRDWDNLTSTGQNRPYANFGCSVTANLAAQIANPADLLAPRDSQPVDAQRREVVMDHYRKGENTSTAKDEQSSGAISHAVP